MQEKSFEDTESNSSNEKLNLNSSDDELGEEDKADELAQIDSLAKPKAEGSSISTMMELKRRYVPQFVKSPVIRHVNSIQGNISQDRSVSSNS